MRPLNVRSGQHGEGAGGNREVSPLSILRACRDMCAAGAQAHLGKEGGSRGKHGFPLATEPKAAEVLAEVAA
jgi:hypothetical protein